MTLDHAVVVGGSFAGIATARVLADHFDRVTIVECDELPDEPVIRRGVPQGGHVHGILKIGRETLDDLFPGFVEETEREGALLFDMMAWMAGFGPNGWGARGSSAHLRGYAVRRPLLEHVARRRVLALPNVGIVRGRCEELMLSPQRGITGVLVAGDLVVDSGALAADLVVDASGRGSAAPAWLERAGFTPPDETRVDAFGGYASRLLRVPEDAWPGDMRAMATLPHPSNTKGAILYPQDNGLHIVSLFGQSRDYPPRDEDGFDRFLRQISTPLIHQVVSRATPVSEIRTSRSTGNRWRHYETLSELPGGFAVLGDAAAYFNPMAGQGISSACLGAVILGETLREVDGDLNRLPLVFQSRLAERLTYPWQQALGFDLQFPATEGSRAEPTPEGLDSARYLASLAQLATVDVAAGEAIGLASQLFDGSYLRTPELVAKVEAWVAEGRTPPNTDPTRPPQAGHSTPHTRFDEVRNGR
jgi:2-polyprenyl-6-methoxyphenol hydroxylase-like FAD-dependent oxidoreductase